MIPGPFEYHSPHSKDEVLTLMQKYGDEGRVIAGGHSLIPMMKLRLAVPEHIIDLKNLAELKGISVGANSIEIGAMVTQSEIINSNELGDVCPILGDASKLIADPQIRYLGTIGGNVANGDPGNDMPAIMQCLDASYTLDSQSGSREVRARDFYEGAYFTARGEGELLTKITIPKLPAGHGYAYEKLKRKVGDYATAAAAVILTMQGNTVVSASVALTNVADTPLYVSEATRVLAGSVLDAAQINSAVQQAEAICDPVADGRGPAEYRTKMAGQMVRSALALAAKRAQA